MEKGHIVTSYLFEVTPSVAEKMLERNYDKNRRISKQWITQLATMMLDGSYIYDNGQNAIVVDEDGTLYDGQHRLMAVIEAGVTQLMRINVVDDGEAIFKTLDNGKTRTAGNFIGNNVATIARVACCIERGSTSVGESLRGYVEYKRVLTRPEVMAYYQANKAKVDRLTSEARRMYATLHKGSLAVFGGFIDLMELLGEDVADFVDMFCSDDGNEVSPIKFTIVRRDDVGRDRQWLLGTLLQGYEIVKAGKKVKALTQQSRYVDKYDKLLRAARLRGYATLQEVNR